MEILPNIPILQVEFSNSASIPTNVRAPIGYGQPEMPWVLDLLSLQKMASDLGQDYTVSHYAIRIVTDRHCNG